SRSWRARRASRDPSMDRLATCRTPGWKSRAPRRSTAREHRLRPGHGPTGTSFREGVLGEVRGGAAQDLVLHLQAAGLTAQLHDLGLLRGRLALADAVIDVGLAHPTAHRLGRDIEVGRDLGDLQITAPCDRDHVTLELRRE